MNDGIRQLAQLVNRADGILVGVGSGMSSAAGYNHYHWTWAMEEFLGEFQEQYGFTSPFAGFYHCYSTYEEQWAYYARYIQAMHRLPTGQPYLDLGDILKGKDFFILTSNVDMQCERVFPAGKIWDFQGSMEFLQCSQPCHDQLYPTRQLAEEMVGATQGMAIPRQLVPRCPHCGRVMVPWVRDDTFLEGSLWRDGAARYQQFLNRYLTEQQGKRLLLLELGVGEMTLSVIKLPFWELTAKNPGVRYACLNLTADAPPAHIKEKSLALQGDLGVLLAQLKEALQQERNEKV